MKKIALVTDNINKNIGGGSKYGGGYVVSKNLIFALAQMPDIELTVFSEEESHVEYSGFKVVKIPYNNRDKKYFVEIDKIIAAENFDVVLSVNVEKVFHNVILQSQSFEFRYDNYSFLIRAVKRLIGEKKLKRQKELFGEIRPESKFFAVSHSVKKDYQKYFGLNPENVFVAYPSGFGVANKEDYVPPEKQSKITFGIVANNSINKGGHLLVFVLGIVKLFGYDFNLKLIYPNFNKDFFIKTVIKVFGMEADIEPMLAQSNMEDFYSKIDVLVCPSLNEAFGLVVLEAGLFGVPSLVSSTVGAAEVLNESNGFVFNRKSLKDFVQSIKNIIDIYNNNFELFKKYSKNAYDMSKKYTWESFALDIINKF